MTEKKLSDQILWHKKKDDSFLKISFVPLWPSLTQWFISSLKFSRTEDYSLTIFCIIWEVTLGIYRENLPCEFAARICHNCLPWEFTWAICSENLPQKFVVRICHKNLPRLFTMRICCDYLPWVFLYMRPFIRELIPVIWKQIFFKYEQNFLFVRLYLLAVFFLLLLRQLLVTIEFWFLNTSNNL